MSEPKKFDQFTELAMRFRNCADFIECLKGETENRESAEMRRNNRNEMILAAVEIMDNGGDVETLIDAIIAGEIPHVKYEG